MSGFLAKKIVVPDQVLVRMVDDEAVLLNLETERYFGLDPVGARMWAVLSEAASVQQALETLLAEYEVDPETLANDLQALLEKLVEHGLVEISDA
ncbi:MAG TPA: PqqD family protein [Anaerolineales bacterium]|nr:PqqD family protein [Anaerolineales bacterium]